MTVMISLPNLGGVAPWHRTPAPRAHPRFAMNCFAIQC